MRHLVVTGGTEGIGRGLALAALARGDAVTVLSRMPHKGRDLFAEAERAGYLGRGRHIAVDLSSCAKTLEAMARLREFEPVDAMVLCAKYVSAQRVQTPEGFEQTFAMYYLSRFLLSHGLFGRLEAAAAPVVVNVSGPSEPGAQICWDDLSLTQNYNAFVALMQGVFANDLLGLSFVAHHPGARTRYVLYHPGLVATPSLGDYDEAMEAVMTQVRQVAKPVEAVTPQLLRLIDTPPSEPLSAHKEGQPIAWELVGATDTEAHRLDKATRAMLGQIGITERDWAG